MLKNIRHSYECLVFLITSAFIHMKFVVVYTTKKFI